MELTHETLYLLALLDLHTERLLQEVEPLILANANREAAEAAYVDKCQCSEAHADVCRDDPYCAPSYCRVVTRIR